MMGFFRRWRRRREEPPTIPAMEVFFADLAAARALSGYSEADRRRDFRHLFLGSAAGKRVLYELLAWSHLFASTFVPGDSHATHWREGGRDVGLRILAALMPEPPVRVAGRGPADDSDGGEGARP